MNFLTTKVFSIVLRTMVDHHYTFLLVVGYQGRIRGGGVFRNSSISEALNDNSLNLPAPKPLSQSSDPMWT